jgi:hypothetical protein
VRVLIGGSAHGLNDAHAVVNRLGAAGSGTGPGVFVPDRDILAVRAPLVVTLAGALGADAGAPTLHCPLGRGVFAAAQSHQDPIVRLARLAPDLDRVSATLELPLAHFRTSAGPVPYAVVRDFVHRHADRRWAARALGVLLAVLHEREHRLEEGLTLAVAGGDDPASPVPGAGPSETLALLRATTVACGLPADGANLARLAHIADTELPGLAASPPTYTAAVRAASSCALYIDGRPSGGARLVPWPADIHLGVLDIDMPPGPLPLATARHGLRTMLVHPGAAGPAVPDTEVGLATCTPERFDTEWAPALPEWLPDTTGPDATRHRLPARALARAAIAGADRARTLRALLEAGGSKRDARLAAVCTEGWREHVSLGIVPGALAAAVDTAAPAFLAAGGIGVLDATCSDAPRLVVLVAGTDDAAVALLAAAIERGAGSRVTTTTGTSPGLLRFGTLRLRRVGPGGELSA